MVIEFTARLREARVEFFHRVAENIGRLLVLGNQPSCGVSRNAYPRFLAARPQSIFRDLLGKQRILRSDILAAFAEADFDKAQPLFYETIRSFRAVELTKHPV